MQSIPDFSSLLKIAQSPAGQKLLSLIHTANPADLQKAAASASAGDMDAAKGFLSDILSSQEAKDLLKQLEKSI